MLSSDMAEIREDGLEQFEKVMSRLREEFELEISKAELPLEDRENYTTFTDHKRLQVMGESIMSTIARIFEIEIAQWVETVMEIHDPEHSYKLMFMKSIK